MTNQFGRTREWLGGISIFLVFALFTQTAAAEGFDLQQFNPSTGSNTGFLSTSGANVEEHLQTSGMLLFNYANDPLVARDTDRNRLESLVAHQGTAHLLLKIGLFGFMELELDVPLVLFQTGANVAGTGVDGSAGFGIGDIRLVPKVQLFSTRDEADSNGMALAFFN